MIARQFDFNCSQRTLLAYGGGMGSACGTLATLFALRTIGIELKSFTVLIGLSASHFVLALLAAEYTLEEIARIFVRRSYKKMFPRVHHPISVIARCRYSSLPEARHYALAKAIYGCTGVQQFWQDHDLHGFPEKLCIPAVDEFRNVFAFTGEDSFVHLSDGEYIRLGGPPREMTPISQSAGAIPGVMQTNTCEHVTRLAVGAEAVTKLPRRESYILDGGLADNILELIGRHHSINRDATVVCFPCGPAASNDQQRYRSYTGHFREGVLPKMELSRPGDRDVAWYLETPVNLPTLAFGASSMRKWRNTVYAWNGALQLLSSYMDVPPPSVIKEEQNKARAYAFAA